MRFSSAQSPFSVLARQIALRFTTFFSHPLTPIRLALAAGLLVATPFLLAAPPARPAKTNTNFGQLPLSFEANQGQTDPTVKFMSQGQGYTLFLTSDEAILELQRKGVAVNPSASSNSKADTSVLRMKLIGASSHTQVTGADPLPGQVNYFMGGDPSKWHTGLSLFGKVNYSAVYPGVNLVYYGNQRQLEYDFVLAPGADPNQIALSFTGSTPKVDANGDLLLPVSDAAKDIRFQKPVVYQLANGQRHVVEARYLLAGNRVTFDIGPYDNSRELVIDPLLVYASYLGGSQRETGTGIAVDTAGNVYVSGSTQSPNFPTLNPIQTFTDGNYHVFVTKVNATGTALVYSTYLGGSHNEQAFDLALDSSNNVYVVGLTSSDDFPVTPGVAQPLCAPYPNSQGVPTANCVGEQNNGFVTKLNATGSALVYSTFIGGSEYNAINAIAVNSAGEAYVAGSTNAWNCDVQGIPAYTCFPTTSGAFQSGYQVNGGSMFATFTKLNAAGTSFLYSTVLGDTAPNQLGVSQFVSFANGIAVDSKGMAYVAGQTLASDFYTTAQAFQKTAAPILQGGQIGGYRGFVTKFNPAGSGNASIVYSTFLGGNNSNFSDLVQGIAVDTTGSAYVTGVAGTNTFPTTKGAFQPACFNPGGFCNSGFVSKLNSAGSKLTYSTYLANTDGAVTYTSPRIRIDAAKNAYVTMMSNSGAFPLQNPIQTYEGSSLTMAVLNATGKALLFSTYLAGNGYAVPYGLAIDKNNVVYLTGQTNPGNPDEFATPGVFQPVYGGGEDAFVIKVAPVAADVSVQNSAPGTVKSGANLQYSILVTNNGPDSAGTVTITDAVPVGSTFVSYTTSDGTCKAPAVGAKGTLSCKAAILSGGSVTITMTVKVTLAAGKKLSDTAKAATTLLYDPNTANNSSVVSTTVD
jgi:uncharacterized repeat protein (TIGR01451 family)